MAGVRDEGFEAAAAAVDPGALRARAVQTLQLNLGLRCDLCCPHCHQSSSPLRTERMNDRVFSAALRLACRLQPELVDVTGGSPELDPDIRERLTALRRSGLRVQLRTNLTALGTPGASDLPGLFARLGVRLLASLPSWDPQVYSRHRDCSRFQDCIEAVQDLNAVGYGTGQGLRLDLAVNATEPERAEAIEETFRAELGARYGIAFDSVVCITNVPLGRFAAALEASGQSQAHLAALRAAFNPATVSLLACRTNLAVGWDGRLYDCDFNLGAALPVRGGWTVFDADETRLASRSIAFGDHCFACTAGAGSS